MSRPLLRNRWSNEHYQAALFIVLLLYLAPRWLEAPPEMWGFAAALALGLAIDFAAGLLRYAKPVCSVSAAVTVGILQVLTPGVPLWGRLLGVAIALVPGKHLQGGTGKNIINPAVTGLLALSLIFGLQNPILPDSMRLLPAFLLSLPFLLFRPFAGLGLLVGMTAALISRGFHDPSHLLGYAVFFWSCLVITDPVTTTPRPWAGLAGGLATGFLPAFFSALLWPAALALLAFNVFSYALDHGVKSLRAWFPVRPRVRRALPDLPVAQLTMRNLAPDTSGALHVLHDPTPEEIIARAEEAGVFGCGGAAFPAARKIGTVRGSGAPRKYLLINGVECDPGLVHDRWLLRSHPREIVAGIGLAARCAPFARVILAVRDRGGLTFQDEVEVYQVRDRYPAGAERLLIREVLQTDLPAGSIPAESGILVLNVQTVFAIYEAVKLGRKAETRYLTVADLLTGRAGVARVRLGSPIADVVEAFFAGAGPVHLGGGLMQCRPAVDEDVVEAGTTFVARADYPRYKESPLCSRCGFCVASCPVRLRVNVIADLAEAGEKAKAAVYRAQECLACGSCSYVCPAGRDLAALVETVKNSPPACRPFLLRYSCGGSYPPES